MEVVNEIKRLEKRVLYTRMSSVLFVAALFIGAYMEVPFKVLAPVVVGAAIALIGIVGIPTLIKLKRLRKLVKSDGESIEN